MEVEVAAHGEQPLEAMLDDEIDRPPAQATIRLRHPAIGEVAVVWKQESQRLMDAKQVAGTIEEITAIG